MDTKRVNAAVRIKIATEFYGIKEDTLKGLRADLARLKEGMTSEELTEYLKRVE